MFYLSFAEQRPGASDASPNATPSNEALEQVAAVEGEEREAVSHEVSAVMVNLLPWGVSILLHAGLVLLAIFVVWSTMINMIDEKIIIPDASFSPTQERELTQREQTRTKPTSAAQRNLTKTETPVVDKVKVETVVGVTGAANLATNNPFGNIGAGDGPFQTGFMGHKGNARTVAYIIDASGSLIDTLPFVINELKRSVSALDSKQSFTVIFYQNDQVIEVPPPGLQAATPKSVERVIKWLDPASGNLAPYGSTTPLPAIRQALKYKPQLVYILSDNITGRGRYEIDQKTLLAEIRAANVAGTKINTIQFIYPEKLVAYNMEPTLKLIAEESGGIYKFVDKRELDIQ